MALRPHADSLYCTASAPTPVHWTPETKRARPNGRAFLCPKSPPYGAEPCPTKPSPPSTSAAISSPTAGAAAPPRSGKSTSATTTTSPAVSAHASLRSPPRPHGKPAPSTQAFQAEKQQREEWSREDALRSATHPATPQPTAQATTLHSLQAQAEIQTAWPQKRPAQTAPFLPMAMIAGQYSAPMPADNLQPCDATSPANRTCRHCRSRSNPNRWKTLPEQHTRLPSRIGNNQPGSCSTVTRQILLSTVISC